MYEESVNFGLVWCYLCVNVVMSICAEYNAEGVSEANLDLAVSTLSQLAEKLNAQCVELRRRKEQSGFVADFLIRVRADERDFIEVRCY
jgi:GTPase